MPIPIIYQLQYAPSPQRRPLLLICLCLVLSNIHPLSFQVDPSLLYLRLQFFIRIGYIVEREYAPAEFEEEVCAEGDEYPEGDLKHVSHTWVINLLV
jgi:hypothetical protein